MGQGDLWYTLADSLKEPDEQELKNDYLTAFCHPKTRIVPVESIYRQWAEGLKSELPFAKEKGYLLSDRALHMKAILQRYGLEIPQEMAYTPDHLIIQLEFLGFLLDNKMFQEAEAFLGEHLDWLDDLLQIAEEKLREDNYYLDKIREINQEIKTITLP